MIIFGAGGHTKVVFDASQKEITYNVDDNVLITEFKKKPIVSAYDPILSLNEEVVIAVGDNATRKKIVAKMSHRFTTVFKELTTDYFSNHWLSCILVNENSKGITRETIRLSMIDENIECRPLWKLMHRQPIFKKHPSYMHGTMDLLFKKGLCLPSGSNLTGEEKIRIQEAILAILS
jgi:hypothetical protein